VDSTLVFFNGHECSIKGEAEWAARRAPALRTALRAVLRFADGAVVPDDPGNLCKWALRHARRYPTSACRLAPGRPPADRRAECQDYRHARSDTDAASPGRAVALDPAVDYLNHGSRGLPARRAGASGRCGAPEREPVTPSRRLPEMLAAVRQSLACSWRRRGRRRLRVQRDHRGEHGAALLSLRPATSR
jgi:hypothetical protein